jgi:hypothetical protein
MHSIRKLLVGGLLLSVLAGCQPAIAPMEAPVAFTGKLIAADGNPQGNVLLTFQPMENGHPGSMEVNSQGEFQGELIPGKFIYYVEPSKVAKAADALKKVPPAFQSPAMEHQVSVESGRTLEIRLQ